MRKVYIEHNPYRSTTKVLIDREQPEQNSWFNGLEEKRLQDWVEELPQRLEEECNDDVEVTFHGIAMDYADVVEVCKRAVENDCRIKITTKFRPGKETQDKEAELRMLYQEIQGGPNEALRKYEQIEGAFVKARDNICEVAVIAPMSSGKSTLINALLGEDLLPVSGDACTAILTEIYDEAGKQGWTLSAYDKDKEILIENQENATAADVKKHNGESMETSGIVLRGKIPFVSSGEIRLKLVDTPGPDSSTHPEHRRVQKEYLNDTDSLILFVLSPDYRSDGKSNVLKEALEIVVGKINDRNGGKKSSDRFIFVLTCMDEIKKKNDGELAKILQKAKDYLESEGISHPKIFPVSAKAALDIRRWQAGKADPEEESDAKNAVDKFNRLENGKYLEEGAPLPQNLLDEISNRLKQARQAGDEWEEALIHTGIPPLELAIEQYVRKYAKVENIKRIVERMKNTLADGEAEDKLNQMVLENKKEFEKHLSIYQKLENELQDEKAAKAFTGCIEDLYTPVKEDMDRDIQSMFRDYQGQLTKEFEKYRLLKELPYDEAKKSVDNMKAFAEKMEDKYIPQIQERTKKKLQEHAQEIYAKYRKYLNHLAEIVTNIPVKENMNPLNLVRGRMSEMGGLLEEAAYKKNVPADGYYGSNSKFTIKNLIDPRWWLETIKRVFSKTPPVKKKFVKMDELEQNFLVEIEKNLRANGDLIKKYVDQQGRHIFEVFQKEAESLEGVLSRQREKMEHCQRDKVYAEKQLEVAKCNLQWLKEIKTKMDAILDI